MGVRRESLFVGYLGKKGNLGYIIEGVSTSRRKMGEEIPPSMAIC